MYKKCIIASEIRKLYETVEFMLSNKVENDMGMGKKWLNKGNEISILCICHTACTGVTVGLVWIPAPDSS